MEAKIEKNRLSLNVHDLIDSLDDEGIAYVIDSLSCQSRVIACVAAQIVEGWTEAGSYGPISYAAFPQTALDEARSLCAKSASEVASGEIQRLQRHAKQQEELVNEYRTKMVNAEQKLYELQARHSR